MTTFLRPHEDRIYAGFRIVAGFLFLEHGLQKCLGLLGGSQADTPMMWVAGAIELFAGVAITIGFQARWAAFLASGFMAVAYFMVHQARGLFPIENGGEPAIVYSFVFLLIAVRGAGTWSLDGSR